MEYERLKRGWAKDLTDEQREEILVDFDTKYLDAALNEDFSDGEIDESFIEVTDEFGRTRKINESRNRRPLTPERKSETVSRHLLSSSDGRANVIYGDYMATFTPDPDKVWEINNREDKGLFVILRAS